MVGPRALPRRRQGAAQVRRVADRLGRYLVERHCSPGRAVGGRCSGSSTPLRCSCSSPPWASSSPPSTFSSPTAWPGAGGHPHHAVGARRHRGRAHPDARGLRGAQAHRHPRRARVPAGELLAPHPGRGHRLPVAAAHQRGLAPPAPCTAKVAGSTTTTPSRSGRRRGAAGKGRPPAGQPAADTPHADAVTGYAATGDVDTNADAPPKPGPGAGRGNPRHTRHHRVSNRRATRPASSRPSRTRRAAR